MTSAWKETVFLRLFSLIKIPLIYFVRPQVVTVDDRQMVLKIPLVRRNKNHLGTMYFGALCIGGEMAAGLIAMRWIRQEKLKVSLIFKDFQAEFLKRAEGDVHFTCQSGQEIRDAILASQTTGVRQNISVPVVATVPQLGSEPVAQFRVTISFKSQGD